MQCGERARGLTTEGLVLNKVTEQTEWEMHLDHIPAGVSGCSLSLLLDQDTGCWFIAGPTSLDVGPAMNQHPVSAGRPLPTEYTPPAHPGSITFWILSHWRPIINLPPDASVPSAPNYQSRYATCTTWIRRCAHLNCHHGNRVLVSFLLVALSDFCVTGIHTKRWPRFLSSSGQSLQVLRVFVDNPGRSKCMPSPRGNNSTWITISFHPITRFA